MENQMDPQNCQHCPPGTMPYAIKQGDTFFALAARFGTTVDAIKKANPGVDPERLRIGQIICIPVVAPPVPVPCPAGTMPYVIMAGDTFFSLARRFGTTVDAIRRANPGVDPDRLVIGQRICIPVMMHPVPCPPCPPIPCPPGTMPYLIMPGDTYFSLARRFGTSVDALLRANPGVDPDRLMVGQRICIPVMTHQGWGHWQDEWNY